MFHESSAAVLDVADVCSWPTHSERLKVVTRTHDPLILLVDDDQELQELVATILSREGYRVSRARDGVEALEKVRKLGPSVIVMDLCLPRLDGYSVIRWLKSKRRTRDIPIVAITGYGMDGEAGDRARDAGCDEFFEKPLQMRRFLACVRQLADLPSRSIASGRIW